MTQQEITEGNKLIAEFMGKTVYPEKGTKEHKKWKGEFKDFQVFQLKYHESWDWLMPVVEKIESLSILSLQFHVIIDAKKCIIESKEEHYIFASKSNTKILATLESIIEFIKWHNLKLSK